MNISTPAIGNPVQARCTKCRKTTTHTILAMGVERPSELQCNKCSHTTAARKPIERRIVDPQKAKREEWATLRPGMDSSRATDYSMTTAYKAKALVNHAIFGLGLVRQISGLQKMVVLFADGEKVMRCK